MNDTNKILELNEILARAAAYASSSRGRAWVRALTPSPDRDEVEHRLQFTVQAALLINKYRYGGIETFDDIEEILDKARAGATLAPGELLRVATVLRSARLAKSGLSSFSDDVDKIKDIAYRIFADEQLEADIKRDILSESEIADTASDELKSIRGKLKNMKSKLIDKLSSFTKSNTYSKYLQDNFYTLRAGRYVLPVKNECRQNVPGLLHDQSATGATVFIEPFEVVTMNNDIVRLEGDEQREIERILQSFSARVLNQSDNLTDALERLTLLDGYFALAGYSEAIEGVRPIINHAKCVNLISARHPLIDPKRVVPIDISVGIDGRNVLLISGPNTGGKTVSLKTVGLLSLMLSIGLLIPCKEGSEMAIFDQIYCDIGDDQNISQNLSTFSSHIGNLKEITESFTNDSLILLDEIGSSTAPEEGAAIAIGVIDFISQTKAKAIITTHYPQLKEYAMTSDRIMNAGMQFDPKTLYPTYKLLMGYPGSSNALETAAALGLAPSIIETAKKRLNYNVETNYDAILKKAFEMKSLSQRELEAAELAARKANEKLEKIAADERKLAEALERINANAKAETKKLVNRAAEKANEIVEEIKRELRDADEKALLKAKRSLKRIEALAYDGGTEMSSSLIEELPESEIKMGVKVIVKPFGLNGVIEKVRADKKQADVNCQGKILKVDFGNLAKSVELPARDTKRSRYVPTPPSASAAVSEEVNVIGQNVSDAIYIIEPILDNSSQSGLKMLRIVHGKGTGVLGRGIQSFLRGHPTVKSYRYGRYGEGDNGVTIVEIK